MESQVYALKIIQRGIGTEEESVTLYVTALTLANLRKYVEVDRWSPDNEDGYQRPPVPRRLSDLAKYVLEEQGILPTSVLLATRPDDPHLKFDLKSAPEDPVQWGLLTVPDGAKLWIVDAQHRFFGVEQAYEKTGIAELGEYPFPISIMDGVDRYTEMTHFNIINTRQRKMPTDIVDRHLVQRQQREGPNMMASGKRGEKEYLHATATRIVDMWNEQQGPWYHQIAIPGVPGRDQGLVRQHAMVASLEPVLRDSLVKSLRPDEHVVKLLSNFWGALKDAWPEAFDSPGEHRIQATVGIYSMHMVLPVLVQLCRAEGDLTQDKMREVVEKTKIGSDFWHKEVGHPLILGTGMASIRALAQHIIEQLPTSSPEQVKL